MWFSTTVIPGADHAARSAASLSAHDRTLPCNLTVPPFTSTLIRRASSSALRRSALSILCFTSSEVPLGLTSMLLVMPVTPLSFLTAEWANFLLIFPVNSPFQ
jgi:hypothetical protein